MANCCYVTGKASALNVEDLKKFLDIMENEKFMDFDYEEIDDWETVNVYRLFDGFKAEKVIDTINEYWQIELAELEV